jgi:hypothetical protein
MRRLTGLLLLLLVVTRPVAAQDAFEQQRAAALPACGVDPIYLTFENGRSIYRIGERIPPGVEYSPIGWRRRHRSIVPRCRFVGGARRRTSACCENVLPVRGRIPTGVRRERRRLRALASQLTVIGRDASRHPPGSAPA